MARYQSSKCTIKHIEHNNLDRMKGVRVERVFSSSPSRFAQFLAKSSTESIIYKALKIELPVNGLKLTGLWHFGLDLY